MECGSVEEYGRGEMREGWMGSMGRREGYQEKGADGKYGEWGGGVEGMGNMRCRGSTGKVPCAHSLARVCGHTDDSRER